VSTHHCRPRGERTDRIGEPAGVAGGHHNLVDRHSELVGHDLSEDRLVALALRGQTGGHDDGAVGLDPDEPALVWPDAGALDIAGHADADPAPGGAGSVAVSLEPVPVD